MPKAKQQTSKETRQTIQLNGKEYFQDELTDEQVLMVNHLVDLDSQIAQMNFKLQQVQVCRQSFLIQLEASLKQSEAGKKQEDKQPVE